MGQLCYFHLFPLLFVSKLAFFNRPRPFFYPFWLDHLTFLQTKYDSERIIYMKSIINK
jgi:hypothetical protein